MAYPTTAEQMVNRLLTDRGFLAQCVVNDNAPAVKANMVEMGIAPRGLETMKPEQLLQEVLRLPEEVQDEALNVEFRGAAGSAVLNEAVERLHVIAHEEGNDTGGPSRFIGAIVGGIVGIVGAIKGGGSDHGAEAAAIAEAARIEALARAEAQRKADERKKLLMIIGGSIAALVLIIVMIKLAKG